MKIQITSDLHFENEENKQEFILSKEADLLIIAGDLGNQISPQVDMIKAFCDQKPVIFIPGNHDYMGNSIEDTIDFWDAQNIKNFHFLNNKKIEIEGINFIGTTLWSDLYADPLNTLAVLKGMIDYKYIWKKNKTSLVDIDYMQKIFLDSLSFVTKELLSNDKRKVLITHHLPTLMSIHPKYMHSVLNSAFATNLTGILLDAKNLELCIHGHTHDNMDYHITEKLRLICNPLGYPGENPHYVKEKIVSL